MMALQEGDFGPLVVKWLIQLVKLAQLGLIMSLLLGHYGTDPQLTPTYLW